MKLMVNKKMQMSKLIPVDICDQWLWFLLADGYARYWVIDDEIDNRICKLKNASVNKATIYRLAWMEMATSNSFHNQKALIKFIRRKSKYCNRLHEPIVLISTSGLRNGRLLYSMWFYLRNVTKTFRADKKKT